MRTKNKTNELLKRDDHIPNDSEICLENLSFGYDDESLAVQDVSFSIKKGEYVSIIGHNGSGKSTLSKLIDGILVQNKGEIYIDGIKRNDDNALLLEKRLHLSSKIRTASSSELPSGMILPLDLRTNAFRHKIGTPLSKKVQKKSEGKSISIENLRIFLVDRNNELPSQTALPVIRKS